MLRSPKARAAGSSECLVFESVWHCSLPDFNVQQLDQQAESDLRSGIVLTREGRFQQALPHFLSARGRVAETFALEFNLALCYVGTREFKQAIQILKQLSDAQYFEQHSADVDNLLAQALIGDGQQEPALKAFQDAAQLSPKNEKLYLLVSEGCMDGGFYELGAKVLDIGLRNLPESARLHFERGLFRSQMEEMALANRDFELAQKLSPGSDVAYIAAAQQAFFAGDVQKVIRTAREGIAEGHTHYLLLTMLEKRCCAPGRLPLQRMNFGKRKPHSKKLLRNVQAIQRAHCTRQD